MELPCEKTVRHILPAIRSELARELLRLDVSQKSISEKLGITQAAVSYYANKKRGHNVKLDSEVMKEIKNMAKEIYDGRETGIMGGMCYICKMIRLKK